MNRVFLVTGAASGIGREVAERLARRGDCVVATDVNQAALEETAAGWPAATTHVMALDVTDVDAWRTAVSTTVDMFGRLDVLYNIAGFLTPGWVHEFDTKDVDRHFDINTKGVVYGTRIAAEVMVKRGCGHIVNIASMAAYAPVVGLSLYSASKYAVRAFSLAAANELEPHGVAVTVLCPDAVATPMLDKQKDYEEAALTFTAPRVLTVDEVAEALVGKILEKRPLEMAMPRSRKWLARVVDLVPEIARHVRPYMEKQGLAQQRRVKREDKQNN